MKLPIPVDFESDSIWVTYSTELSSVSDVLALSAFLERWRDVYPFTPDRIIIDEHLLRGIKKGEPGDQELIEANIILPTCMFKAMMQADKFGVPFNTAFIQGNGGIGAFES